MHTSTLNRMKHILGFGTLVGLILATFLVLSLRDANRLAAQDLTATTPPITQVTTSTNNSSSANQRALEQQISELQAQNQQLRADLQTMQDREAQYQQQLVQAVQIIQQLQRQSRSSGFR
ncbi:MAG: hypothetical protein R3C14_23890 [Caldilineaceae bacterium]